MALNLLCDLIVLGVDPSVHVLNGSVGMCRCSIDLPIRLRSIVRLHSIHEHRLAMN